MAAGGTRRIHVVVDTDEKGNLRGTVRELDNVGDKADEADDALRRMSKGARVLDAEIKKTSAGVRSLREEFEKTGDISLLGDADKLERNLKRMQTQFSKVVGDLGKDDDEHHRVGEQVGRSVSRGFLDSLGDGLSGTATAINRSFGGIRSSAFLSLTGTLAGIASLSGPAVTGVLAVGKAIAAVGNALALLGTGAVAALPSLIAGFGLFKLAVAGILPAILDATSPIMDAFIDAGNAAGDFADVGLRKVSTEWAKLNAPLLKSQLEEVGKSVNRVALGFMAWANSAAGQQAVAEIAVSTAAAMNKLEGPLGRVLIAFGNLIDRVGGQVLIDLAVQIGRIADATARWLDRLGQDDIDKAAAALVGWTVKIKEVFNVFKDIGTWMEENQGKVKAFSDTLAAAAVGIGIATGNLPAIAAGSFTLVVNHWEEVKSVFRGVQPFFASVWDSVKNDPGVQGIFDAVKRAFSDFVGSFKKGISELGPEWQRLIGDLKEAWEEWAPIIKAWWDGVGRPVLSALGTALGLLVIGFLQLSQFGAEALSDLGAFMKRLWGIALAVFGDILHGAVFAFSWIPGIGPKLEAAERNFEAFRDRVNGALAGIHDRSVSVTIDYHYRTFGKPGTDVYGIGGNDFIGRRHGGIEYAASGMITSSPTVVFGERGTGRETYIPWQGISGQRAFDLMAPTARNFGLELTDPRERSGYAAPVTAAGAGGGGAEVRLSWAGFVSGDSLGRAIIEVIQDHIRINGGGNVQQALGKRGA